MGPQSPPVVMERDLWVTGCSWKEELEAHLPVTSVHLHSSLEHSVHGALAGGMATLGSKPP